MPEPFAREDLEAKALEALTALRESNPQELERLLAAACGGIASGGAPAATGPTESHDLFDTLRNLHANGAGEGNGLSPDLDLPGGKTLQPDGVRDKGERVRVVPTPGWVVKTREVGGTGGKVFINICSHASIGAPAISKRLDENGEEVDAISYPLSLGAPHEESDKGGGACTAYDLLLNPQVLQDASSDPTGAERDAICQLAIQHVESKYTVKLDNRYKLPRTTYKGAEPVVQWVRSTAAQPAIQEISSSATPAGDETNPSCAANGSKKGANHRATHDNIRKPKREPAEPPRPMRCRLEARWAEGERTADISELSVTDAMPSAGPEAWPNTISAEIAGFSAMALAASDASDGSGSNEALGIDLQLSAFGISCSAAGHESLSLLLPYAVVPERATAIANPHAGTLTIEAPVDMTPLAAGPDPGSRPWLLAQALDDESAEERRAAVPSASSAAAASDGRRGDAASGVGVGSGLVNKEVELPEDRFHLSLPKGRSKYNGAAEDDRGSGDELLPEDAFHRTDIMSQHILDSRERERKEKHERAAKERKERAAGPKDDGVEYIDIDEFRPKGTSTAVAGIEEPAERQDPQVLEERRRGAEAVANAIAATGAAVPLASDLYSQLLD